MVIKVAQGVTWHLKTISVKAQVLKQGNLKVHKGDWGWQQEVGVGEWGGACLPTVSFSK